MSDPLVETIAAALRRTVEGGETVTDAAERMLDAIAATGRLVHQDAETFTQHAHRYRISPQHQWTRIIILSEADARAATEEFDALGTQAEAQHLTRVAHTGPWEVKP
jgi:hypothetical protein